MVRPRAHTVGKEQTNNVQMLTANPKIAKRPNRLKQTSEKISNAPPEIMAASIGSPCITP